MSWLKQWTDKISDTVQQLSANVDLDLPLQGLVLATIERARSTYPTTPYGTWTPGHPLKLMFAGYAGTRNTGADARVEEMVRQFRHVLGEDNLELSILTIDPNRTLGYFTQARQIEVPLLYHPFLYEQIRWQHGVVACEGSMFKSKFADSLTAMMAQALGLAVAGKKLSIAYGGEAGSMSPSLKALVQQTCRDAFVITRNENSQDVLGDLGIKTELGTDTAWSFEPAPDAVGQAALREAGWDGETPILCLCPINPFWWPVKPSLGKSVQHGVLGLHHREHYRSVYFHHGGDDVDLQQATYLDALAAGARRFVESHGAFVIVAGSEALDRFACEALAKRLDNAPVFVSDDHDMFDFVSIIRQSTYMVSSRYHAIVTTMPAGVASIGVTMDERIRNLMNDRETPELSLEVDDRNLATKLYQRLTLVHDERERVVRGIERTVVRNLKRMGEMGVMLARHVKDRLPDYPLPEGMGDASRPWDHLPPLSTDLNDLIDRHGDLK